MPEACPSLDQPVTDLGEVAAEGLGVSLPPANTPPERSIELRHPGRQRLERVPRRPGPLVRQTHQVLGESQTPKLRQCSYPHYAIDRHRSTTITNLTLREVSMADHASINLGQHTLLGAIVRIAQGADDGAFIGSPILGTRRAGRGPSAEDQENPTLLITQRLAHIVRAKNRLCLKVVTDLAAFSAPEFTGSIDWTRTQHCFKLNPNQPLELLFKDPARSPNPSLICASAVPNGARRRTRDQPPADSIPGPQGLATCGLEANQVVRAPVPGVLH